jgi:hypothetical protein
LALKYRCDKFLRHSYIWVYERLFADMQVNALLEIGIGTPHLMEPFVPGYIVGSSLWMWQDYFPEAQIYSCDIDASVLINTGRIWSWQCDQSSEESLRALMSYINSPLDIVIDDGSHETAHQLLTARTLLPFVRKGGWYVIEDVREPEALTRELPGATSIHLERTFDDTLVLIGG